MAGSKKETAPNPYVSPKAMDAFLLMLARCNNPDTGRLYTHGELAEIFHRHPSSIGKFLNKHDIYRRPAPELSNAPISENEKAFYLGLALGSFQIEHVTWAQQKYVVMGTNSQNPTLRKLLKETIGTRGAIHKDERELKIYLNPTSFDFLSPEFIANPGKTINHAFLDVKSKFAPFLAGFLAARLSEKEHRLTFPSAGLQDRICNAFSHHYGFPLGNNLKRRNANSYPIAVHDPARVFRALLGTPSVQSLPFIHVFMPQTPSPDGRANKIPQRGAIFP